MIRGSRPRLAADSRRCDLLRRPVDLPNRRLQPDLHFEPFVLNRHLFSTSRQSCRIPADAEAHRHGASRAVVGHPLDQRLHELLLLARRHLGQMPSNSPERLPHARRVHRLANRLGQLVAAHREVGVRARPRGPATRPCGPWPVSRSCGRGWRSPPPRRCKFLLDNPFLALQSVDPRNPLLIQLPDHIRRPHRGSPRSRGSVPPPPARSPARRRIASGTCYSPSDERSRRRSSGRACWASSACKCGPCPRRNCRSAESP